MERNNEQVRIEEANKKIERQRKRLSTLESSCNSHRNHHIQQVKKLGIYEATLRTLLEWGLGKRQRKFVLDALDKVRAIPSMGKEES